MTSPSPLELAWNRAYMLRRGVFRLGRGAPSRVSRWREVAEAWLVAGDAAEEAGSGSAAAEARWAAIRGLPAGGERGAPAPRRDPRVRRAPDAHGRGADRGRALAPHAHRPRALSRGALRSRDAPHGGRAAVAPFTRVERPRLPFADRVPRGARPTREGAGVLSARPNVKEAGAPGIEPGSHGTTVAPARADSPPCPSVTPRACRCWFADEPTTAR